MSNLENLISKISTDSEYRAMGLIFNAKAEAEKIIASNIAEATEEKAQIMAEAQREAEMTKAQIITGRRLLIRDGKLKAKQEMIDKTFQIAIERLNKLSQEVFFAFLSNYLLNMDISGEENIMLPKAYENTDISSINQKLTGKGKLGNIKIIPSDKEIEGGFILLKGGIENNNTFRSLLDYYRDDLEGQVVSSLF